MIQEKITSQIFAILEGFIGRYGRTVFEHTSEIFLGIFMVFYACRLMWIIGEKSITGKGFDVKDIVKPIVICAFLGLVMRDVYYIEEWVFVPAKDLAVSLATMTAAVLDGNHFGDGPITIVDMLNLVDQRLNQVVFQPCQAIGDSISWLKTPLHVGLWVIQALYILVWFLFVALMTEALFRFMTFLAISPLIITSYFFEMSKPVFTAGLRSLLHGVLSMFMAGVAMGMTISIIGSTPELFFVEGSTKMTSDWIFGPQYFTLVLIALISISFHLKAPKVAANLANIDDGPGAAAAVAGLGTAAVMSGKAMVSRMAGRTAGTAGKYSVQGAKKLAPHAWKGAKWSAGTITGFGKF